MKVLLSQYQDNPEKNWRNFDAAICIIISLVSRGKTQRHGVTQISTLIDLSQFFESQVLNELQRTQGITLSFRFEHKFHKKKV